MDKKQIFPIVILDFDGVILESVDVKTRAFRDLFSFASEHVDEIVNFHVQNGGMSRFDKFKHFYKNILKEPLSNEQYYFLCNRFSELVFDGVLKSKFVPGAEKFLSNFATKTSLFVASATPEPELTEIIKQRGLLNYFKAIYGAPRTKQECIEELLINMDCPKDNAIFVGDSLNDYKAAQEAGVRFVGRMKYDGIDIFKELSGVEIVISDLNKLSSYLEDLDC